MNRAEAVRINRYLSMCGVTSRRKAEELVLSGRVTVNGRVVRDLATRIDPAADKVTVNARAVAPSSDHVYIVLNKPKDTITTLSDERGRNTVMSLIRSRRRVYPVGRLDRNTTGVLIFTNDGDFAHHLMHPRFEIPKSYHVTCATAVSVSDVAQLRRGIRLGDEMTAPAHVETIAGTKGRELGIVIHEGRNRQVRNMLESLGYEVLKLDRVAYGPVTKRGLARGESRSLTRQEIRELRRLAGLDTNA